MSQAPSRVTVTATVALLIMIWGTTWSVIRISLEGFPPLTGAAIRFFVAAVVLGAVAGVRKVSLGGWPNVWLWLVQGVLAFSVTYGVVYWAEQWVPSGLTSVLFSTLPLFVVVFAYVMLPGERLGTWGLLGVALGFAGVGVIFSDDLGALSEPQVRRAARWVLISPIGAALAQVVMKRWGHGVHYLSLTAPPMLLTALILGALAGFFERGREIVWAPAPVAAILYLAIAGSAVTFTLFFWLLKHVTATQLSLIAYAVPVVAVAVGTAFFGEPLTPRMVAGSAVVIAGVAIAVHPRPKKATGDPSS